MNRTPEIFEKIEEYLEKKMSQEEREAFEKEITNNPELQQEIEKHASLHSILSDKDTLEFKKKLIKISTQLKEEQTSSRPLFSSYWKIAASVIVVLGVGTLLWNTIDDTQSTEDLYASYYEPFLAEDITRGQSDIEFQDIIKSYNRQDYVTVIGELEKLPNINNQEKLQLYLANSYLNTNQEEKAITLLEDFGNNSTYYEFARWYLSLTYVKLGKKEIAANILKEVILYDGIYKNKATQLKKELQK